MAIAARTGLLEEGLNLGLMHERSCPMRSVQQLRAQARQNARTAPKPDPAIGKAARAEAEAAMATFNRSVEPAYKTQAKRCGTIMHRGSGRPMSEFGDPSANTVGAGKRTEKDFGRG